MDKLPKYITDLQEYENRVQPNVMTIGFKLYEEIVKVHESKLKWQSEQIVKLNKIIAEWETKPPAKPPVSPTPPPPPSTPAPVNPPLPAEDESGFISLSPNFCGTETPIVSAKKIKRSK